VSWFEGRRATFYFRGLSGLVARGFRSYLQVRPRLAAGVSALFDARCLDEQRHVYDTRVEPHMWGAGMNWTVSRQITMSLLGVPMPQRREVVAQHAGGITGFVRDAIGYVFRRLPAWTNYFWAVYLRGRYSPGCCPEYLKPENFAALQGGLADCIRTHSCTVTEFLNGTDERISKFVLLDHMDWMSCYYPEALAAEWAAILDHATPDARAIFRSAHAQPAYLDAIVVGCARERLRDVLRFHDELARELTRDDRVHTYAGFHIADVRT
jgi:S-adenosylmethionine-diacylglycerol 3-amino-3-carboxypropyl transferase